MRAQTVLFGWFMIYTCGRGGSKCGVDNKRQRSEKIFFDPNDNTRLMCDEYCRTCGEFVASRLLTAEEAENLVSA